MEGAIYKDIGHDVSLLNINAAKFCCGTNSGVSMSLAPFVVHFAVKILLHKYLFLMRS
jgi:hypothetical protein